MVLEAYSKIKHMKLIIKCSKKVKFTFSAVVYTTHWYPAFLTSLLMLAKFNVIDN